MTKWKYKLRKSILIYNISSHTDLQLFALRKISRHNNLLNTYGSHFERK